ncbi:MAG TPA: dihydrofolate reductase [Candidatus Nanoarchaeia archaeon]|nr:dihydrofolate reductase [Candidatus Nanoarchaeia archaeon]
MIIVAAMTRKRIIGKNNQLPWDIPEEMKHFRSLTKGGICIMGRRTFESIGSKPLPNRKLIVVSHSLGPVEGVDVCKTVEEAVKKAKSYDGPIFILGGAQIYEKTIPIADKMYISYIKKGYEGDTYFPEFDEDDWKVERREDHQDFEFVVYARKKGDEC